MSYSRTNLDSNKTFLRCCLKLEIKACYWYISEPIGHCVLFADDTDEFIEDVNEKAYHKKANDILEFFLYGYMKCNQQHINVGYSCYIHFKPTLDR